MNHLMISLTRLANVAMIAICVGAVATEVRGAPLQTASAPPARPLANPNIDQVYLNIRNGNYRAQTTLGAPYARAKSFVDCAGGSIKAQPILSTDFGSQQESRLIDQTVRRNLRCGGTAAGIPVFLLRAAISESALKDEKASDGAMRPVDVATTSEMGIDPSISPELGSALRVAQCQVKAERITARTVVMAPMGSAEEKTAKDKLFSSASRCGGGNVSATLDSVAYRAVIASVLGRDAVSGRTDKK